MNLLADEGIDSAVVERLREDGHDVVYVAELAPGIPDEEVLIRAKSNNSLLLTADKDFGELVFRQKLVHSGVMLLRLAGLENAAKANLVAEACREREQEILGAFSVISPGQLRIRQRT